MEWRCDADNHAGRKLAARLGFVAEGTLRKHMVWRDANRDTALYALTNADWREEARDALEALVLRRMKDAGLSTKTKAAADAGDAATTAPDAGDADKKDK